MGEPIPKCAVLLEKATEPNGAAKRGKSKAALAEELPAFGEVSLLGMAELLHLHCPLLGLSPRHPRLSLCEPESFDSSPDEPASSSNNVVGFDQVFLQFLISFFFSFFSLFASTFNGLFCLDFTLPSVGWQKRERSETI